MSNMPREKATQSSGKSERKALGKRTITPDEALRRATMLFLNDLDCIKEMYGVVVPVLAKKDEERRKKLDQTIQHLKALTEVPEESKKPTHKLEERMLNEIEDVKRNVLKINRASILFRQNTIVVFVARYDTFLSEVLRAIFRAHPERFRSPERTLSYDEILQLKSLKQALDRFIEKEIDEVLRESHASHIAYLDKQLKVNLQEIISSWKDFIELTERRNLFVHTGGRVSTQYLQVCKTHEVTLDAKITKDGHLGVDEKYLINAYRSLFEVGLKVGQTIYRKLWPKKIENADKALIDIGYDMLVAEQWDIAKMVFDFGLSLPTKLISSDETHKILLIDECIALKWSGQKESMHKLLKSVDWSAADPKFLLAVAVLKENFKQAETIMSSMGKHKPIAEHSFRTWPLFRQFRHTIYFRRAFKEIYGKEFQLNLEPANTPKLPAKRLKVGNP